MENENSSYEEKIEDTEKKIYDFQNSEGYEEKLKEFSDSIKDDNL